MIYWSQKGIQKKPQIATRRQCDGLDNDGISIAYINVHTYGIHNDSDMTMTHHQNYKVTMDKVRSLPGKHVVRPHKKVIIN